MRSDFGTTSKGENASLYTMKNKNGMTAAVSDYGAVLVKVLVPDRDGNMQDVVLGYDDVRGYESGTLYFGATVGRVANRIGGGSFELNGRTYGLTQNDGSNTLCIEPGKVVVYDRNYVTNQILRENGIRVLEMSSSELSRGRGGPRCMSMPLERESIEKR